jgi:hypothetical protein
MNGFDLRRNPTGCRVDRFVTCDPRRATRKPRSGFRGVKLRVLEICRIRKRGLFATFGAVLAQQMVVV